MSAWIFIIVFGPFSLCHFIKNQTFQMNKSNAAFTLLCSDLCWKIDMLKVEEVTRAKMKVEGGFGNRVE